MSHSCSKYINIKSKLEKNNTKLTPSLATSDGTLLKFMVVMVALKISKQYIRDCRVHQILEGNNKVFIIPFESSGNEIQELVRAHA